MSHELVEKDSVVECKHPECDFKKRYRGPDEWDRKGRLFSSHSIASSWRPTPCFMGAPDYRCFCGYVYNMADIDPYRYKEKYYCSRHCLEEQNPDFDFIYE